jgi:alpha-galactosidase
MNRPSRVGTDSTPPLEANGGGVERVPPVFGVSLPDSRIVRAADAPRRDDECPREPHSRDYLFSGSLPWESGLDRSLAHPGFTPGEQIPAVGPGRCGLRRSRPFASFRRSGLGLAFAVAWTACAVEVTPQELALARQWVAARFEGAPASASAEPALLVIANHDPVGKDGRGGKPLKLVDREYRHGLYCHAFSQIRVRLPGPGATFTAIVGVDSNEQTSGGRGSVDFRVVVGDQEKFRSGVVHEGVSAQPVSVDLDGATEFLLQVDPTPDGIACDQADWAEAKVRLKDGRELWLAELPLKEQISQRLFAAGPPFSFVYGGKPSADFLKDWKPEHRQTSPDASRTEHTWVRADAQTGLRVRCDLVEYRDFPTVEWTLHFQNTGTNDTPILENIQALELDLDRASPGEFVLHHNVGSPADGNDYGPLETPLGPRGTQRLGGKGGRPTNADWSYFNLDWKGAGLIVAVGWPGQWLAVFTRDGERGLHLRAGQELTHFTLRPGEEVRSPLIVLQFWQGDWIRSQNLWRRWMMAHSMPRPGGRLPAPQLVASSSRQFDEMIKADEANQIQFIDRYVEEGLRLDYWWMDAGWYNHHGGGWPRVGTWEVDAQRFPRGLRAVSDHAHAQGLKTLLWFEPERVAPGTWLADHHPEWILGGAKGGLLDLGNDEARQWLTDHVDRLLTDQGIDLYRQDFNMDPLELWRKNDAPDRQGITEIKHVTGYLAYWDELRRRHPGLLIDSCASGGRRNDVETMRRAVPLWRSDYAYEATGHQCMTYGISLWLPFHGTGTVATRNAPYYGSGATPVEPYAFWSNTSPSLGCGFDMRVKDLDYAALRRLVGQWRRISPNYYGDFYPLTRWSRDDRQWIAWQYDRPDAGEGTVQAFRRDQSPYEAARFPLQGLDPEARYRVERLDAPAWAHEATGRELLEPGVRIELAEAPGAAVLVYRRLP